MAWLSLVPPIPALLLSLYGDQERNLFEAISQASWFSLAAVLYLGVVATSLAYVVWGRLLNRYPAAMVAPFALIAPVAGMIASALTFGEIFTPLRYAGLGLILAGLAVIVLPSVGGLQPGETA